MDKNKGRSEFLKKISNLSRTGLNDILKANAKPVKKLTIARFIVHKSEV